LANIQDNIQEERKMKRTIFGVVLVLLATLAFAGGGQAKDSSHSAVVIWDYFETDAQKQMMQALIDGFNKSQSEFTASHVYVPFSDYER
jgi:ABC-type glycerol-3-phosphate transport system substrate-binding protein